MRDAIFFALREEVRRLGINDVYEDDLEALTTAVLSRLSLFNADDIYCGNCDCQQGCGS